MYYIGGEGSQKGPKKYYVIFAQPLKKNQIVNSEPFSAVSMEPKFQPKFQPKFHLPSSIRQVVALFSIKVIWN